MKNWPTCCGKERTHHNNPCRSNPGCEQNGCQETGCKDTECKQTGCTTPACKETESESTGCNYCYYGHYRHHCTCCCEDRCKCVPREWMRLHATTLDATTCRETGRRYFCSWLDASIVRETKRVPCHHYHQRVSV